MHELAIADAVVRIATAHAGGRRVARVELRVGHLRQVVVPSLEFSFGLVAEGTVVEGAELLVEQVPARVACGRCGAVGKPDGLPLACPRCGDLNVEIVGGEELVVDALEVSDEPLMREEVRSGS